MFEKWLNIGGSDLQQWITLDRGGGRRGREGEGEGGRRGGREGGRREGRERRMRIVQDNYIVKRKGNIKMRVAIEHMKTLVGTE